MYMHNHFNMHVAGIGYYHHVGRTVLTSPERPTAWIEGVSEGEDPLKDRWGDLSDLLDAEVRSKGMNVVACLCRQLLMDVHVYMYVVRGYVGKAFHVM